MTRGTANGDAIKIGAAPLGFIQVAFVGDKPESGSHPAQNVELRNAVRLLRRAGIAQGRLLTALAEDADVLAARAWRDAGLGSVHVVYPFLSAQPPPAAGDLVDHATWLDGRAMQRAGRDAHLAVSRWVVGAADVLIVVWNGQSATRSGRAAEAVRLAIERRIPVVWIRPGHSRPRLVRAEHLDEDCGFGEFIDMLVHGRTALSVTATSQRLRASLIELGFVGNHPPRHSTRRGRARDKRARAYRTFRRVLGGKAPVRPPAPAPPDLQAQPGFARLTSAYLEADAAANGLGALHRSRQVILLCLAVLAAGVGSTPALWPQMKLLSVAAEFVLAVGALLIWRDSERGHPHQRWAKARRLAEDLRLERIAWTLGLASTPLRPNSAHDQAAHERRLAGLPIGSFGPDRVSRWAPWALHELIAGQAAYHHLQATINARISRRVHLLENVSFTLLLGLLVAYLAAAMAATLLLWRAPGWLDGLVGMAGAIVPAIGAAGLGLEATLALDEEAQRSRALAAQLEVLVNTSPLARGFPAVQSIAISAIRMQRAQEDRWTDGAVRRRLVRGP